MTCRIWVMCTQPLKKETNSCCIKVGLTVSIEAAKGAVCANRTQKKNPSTHVHIFILKTFWVGNSLELAFCKNTVENEMANMI